MSKILSDKIEDYHLITFPSEISKIHSEEMKTYMKNWLLVPVQMHIFDFAKVTALATSHYQHLVVFSKFLRTNNKYLFTINTNTALQILLKIDGLEDAFNFVSSIDMARNQVAAHTQSKNKVTSDFLAPFIDATKQTLNTQANTPVEVSKPFIKDDKHNPDIAIAGVINISSEQFRGSITLTFPKNVFLQVYENMIGEKHTEIDAEIEDACGELLNIIFGVAKAQLNAKFGYTVQKALPTILKGEKVKVRQGSLAPVVILPFHTQSGSFYIEIVSEPNR